MRKTVSKCFWAWEFEKEENWINQMAAKGLVLVKVHFPLYTFEECTPGEYTVRLELLYNLPGHPESREYIRFIEETGAEYLGSVTRWVYFKKKTTQGTFDLYSDNSSRLKHLNRILALLGIISILPICAGLGNISIYFSTNIDANFMNLIYSIPCLGVGLFIVYGFLSVLSKKSKLQKQQNLFE